MSSNVPKAALVPMKPNKPIHVEARTAIDSNVARAPNQRPRRSRASTWWIRAFLLIAGTERFGRDRGSGTKRHTDRWMGRYTMSPNPSQDTVTRPQSRSTSSDIEIDVVYDRPADPERIGAPGEFPYTRGPYPTMY